MNHLEKAKENFLIHEKSLSPYACSSLNAIRIRDEEEDIRPAYFHDIDRIIHSLSYTRYMDKTQVFTHSENDHISKRITHVQLVSKIARTIGRALLLNEDLIEAIALGHDIGHTPLGHVGEAMLNEISLKELGEYFAHNIQSVRHLMVVEHEGKGLNLTVQVLDGIMCHNGEMVDPIYQPVFKDKEEFLREYEEAYHDIKKSNQNHPMTLEGCVVRLSDVVGYIGRDIEDAISLGKIKREDIPEEITSVLGTTNREIVNTIILDVIENSMDKPYIKMSDAVFSSLFALKKFNYQNIYRLSLTKENEKKYREGMERLFYRYLDDLEKKNEDSPIYQIFLKEQSPLYLQENNNKRKVIDFIAGMTDEFFIREIEK